MAASSEDYKAPDGKYFTSDQSVVLEWRSMTFYLHNLLAWMMPSRSDRGDAPRTVRYMTNVQEMQNLFMAAESSNKWMKEMAGAKSNSVYDMGRQGYIRFFRYIPLYMFTIENTIFLSFYVICTHLVTTEYWFGDSLISEVDVDFFGSSSFFFLFLYTFYTDRCLRRYNEFYDLMHNVKVTMKKTLMNSRVHRDSDDDLFTWDIFRYMMSAWFLALTALSVQYGPEFFEFYVNKYKLLTVRERNKLMPTCDSPYGWFAIMWGMERTRKAHQKSEITKAGFNEITSSLHELQFDLSRLDNLVAWPAPRSFRHGIKLLTVGYCSMATIFGARIMATNALGDNFNLLLTIYYGICSSFIVILLIVCEGADAPFGAAPMHFPLMFWAESEMEELRLAFLSDHFTLDSVNAGSDDDGASSQAESEDHRAAFRNLSHKMSSMRLPGDVQSVSSASSSGGASTSSSED